MGVITINCIKCGKYLGEIVKGKLHRKAVVFCEDCNPAAYKSPPKKKVEMPDFLKDLLKV